MLKVDIPVIKEFFGTTENIVSEISPMKHIRIYAKKESREVMFVLSRYMNKNAKKVVINLCSHGASIYKRGNTFVYLLKC